MDERERLISAVVTGEESMAELCRQFGVSRKTGYKWLARYQQDGMAGLVAQSRAPHQHPQAVDQRWEAATLALRAQHPTWGPKKLQWTLVQRHPDERVPAVSTLGRIIQRAGLAVPRRHRHHTPPRTEPLAHATEPNRVWCADFKGDFVTADGVRCYPLTITDAHSRLLLRCQALPTTRTSRVQPLFEATFREYGLPERIRTDNGPPFASVAVGGLTPLSVWWLRLGIWPERITPATPSENGRHERMHRTLKADAITPPAATMAAQQRRFDTFRTLYNAERPHEALGMQPPASVYAPSSRPFRARPPTLTYPTADAVRWVRGNGALRWRHDEVYLTPALAGQPVGLTQRAPRSWQVTFGPLLLGTFREGEPRLTRPSPPTSPP